jgi:hypothetical protein
MNRANVAATIAVSAGVTMVALVAIYRLIDWLFKGEWFLWIALFLTIIVTFLIVFVLDAVTSKE